MKAHPFVVNHIFRVDRWLDYWQDSLRWVGGQHHPQGHIKDCPCHPPATYIYGNYIDEVLSMQRGGNVYYYFHDDLHNVMNVVDNLGDVVDSIAYDDFGTPTVTENSGNPYLFNGQRYDEESGFYYYRTRYLDPSAGRFTTRDTIGIWGDLSNLGNGYAYAGNNPWTFVDPWGMQDGNCDPCGGKKYYTKLEEVFMNI